MPPKTEQQVEQNIAEAEEQQCGLQTQLISNPGGQAIPPLTRASCRELLTPSQLPLPENPPLHTLKKENLDISITSFPSVEEQDPFEKLLTALKNSSRSKKAPQIEEMSKDKKPLGSRLKVELEPEEARISTAMPVQVIAAKKEVKAALP
uniref:Uncharacterized protein n=1 Tax=Moniliophthora roreri TaxID=221103 RepID=A0A0W0F8A3_MONRR